MKIAIGGFYHETNSFCCSKTDLSKFKEHTYLDTDSPEEFTTYFTNTREIAGFVRAAQRYADDIIPLIVAMALPYGPIPYETYDAIKKRMLHELHNHPVDAVFLNLHGAAVVETLDDCEGDLLSSIRKEVGDAVPIFAVLDLHANVSQKMVDNATLLLGYNTEPHIDILEREEECIDIYHTIWQKQPFFTTVLVQPPLLLPALNTDTDHGAMRPLIEAAFDAEQSSKVINVSPFAGFYGSDKFCAGPSVICTTLQDTPLAQDIANRLSHMFWDLKETFFETMTPMEDIIEVIHKHPNNRYAIIDECDDPLGGGPVDGTYILDYLRSHDIHNIGVSTIYDPTLVDKAFEAGVGKYIDGILGAHTDDKHGEPITIHAEVLYLSTNSLPISEKYPEVKYHVGRIAVIDTGYAEVVITERRVATEMIDIFKYLNIDSRKYNILVLKGFGHSYKDVFKDTVSDYFTAASIGINNPDITKIGVFHNLRHPIYPFDKDVSYTK